MASFQPGLGMYLEDHPFQNRQALSTTVELDTEGSF
jgi:hypothetical protein